MISCQKTGQINHIPEAVNGVMDLRTWDFQKSGNLYLKGEWTFFENRLLSPEKAANEKGGYHVQVPGLWNRYDLNGKSMPSKGVGTFRLKVHLPEKRAVFALYCEGQGSAYSLWINNRLSASNGVVGESRRDMVPGKKPQMAFFKPERDELVLVAQVSNFHHRKGGLRNDFMMGMAGQVHDFQSQKWFIQVFSIGLLSVMGFYHLFIFIFRKKNRGPLFFALICWIWVIRLIVINLNTFSFIQPPVTWDIGLKIEYLTFFIAPVIFCFFSGSLYPKDLHPWFKVTVTGFGVLFLGFVPVLDTFRLSLTVTFYQGILLTQIIYYLYFLNRIIVKKRDGAMFIALAFIITFATVIVEALYFQDILLQGEIAHYGFLAFVFIQAILLASLFSRSFERVENLTDALSGANRQLASSEKKYRMIFENSKDIIFIAGLDGQIRDVSPACEAVLGYTKEEIKDRQILSGILGKIIKLRLKNSIIDHGQFANVEVMLQHKGGSRLNALISAALHHDKNGEAIGIQGSVRDVTSIRQIEKERLKTKEFKKIAITDPLTRIYNRRFFTEMAQKEIERARRNRSCLSVVLFDADHFKVINDEHGHLAGDQVLANLAGFCSKNLRKTDLLARFGGEEFVILMPDTHSALAFHKADQLRDRISKKVLATIEDKQLKITVSMGIAGWHGNQSVPDQLNEMLDMADKALYQSKNQGRNRTTLWRDENLATGDR